MIYKTCSKCKKPLPATLEFFSPDKLGKYGLISQCKACRREYGREYIRNNPEQARKYRENNLESERERSHNYYENNKEKVLQRCSKYYKNNSEKVKQYSQIYCKNNKEKIKQRGCKYYQDNKEKVSRRGREYRKNNPDKMAAKAARYRAMKLKQTPILTKAEDRQIKLFYKKREELGSDWHVDHIQPLSKKGLHHPNNLQIVTATYNLEKSDKLGFRLPDKKEIYKWVQ